MHQVSVTAPSAPGGASEGANPDSVEGLFRRLEQLNEIGAALSQERNLDGLLEKILVAAKTITHADGGTLYLTTDDGQLSFAIMRTDSLGIALGGTTDRKSHV